MTFKTLLTFHSPEQKAHSLDQALHLAEAAQAHLDIVVLGVLTSPPIVLHDTAPAAEWVAANREAMENASKAVDEIEKYVESKSVSASVTAECDYPGTLENIAARYALCADVHVADRSLLISNATLERALNGTLFGAGCPLLALPGGQSGLEDEMTIMIAWNGKPEAAHAVHKALPLLKNSTAVHVVVVDPVQRDVGGDPGSDIAVYLSRYGIKVQVDVLASGGMSTIEKLLQHSMDIDAGLLVMGAFGHSKFRERLLGGATHDALHTAELPLFMAH